MRMLASATAICSLLVVTTSLSPLRFAAASATVSLQQGVPAHIRRGKVVVDRGQIHRTRLAEFHSQLKSLLLAEAPELASKLAPPRAIAYGYQLVPKLTDKTSSVQPPVRIQSTPYSWPRTESFLDVEEARLTRLLEQFSRTSATTDGQRHRIYEELVAQYFQRDSQRKLIDRHIKHNLFWQDAVHNDRSRFDRLTELYDALIEREMLRDTVEKRHTAGSSDVPSQIQRLDERIELYRRPVTTPDFLQGPNLKNGVQVFEVAIYTDIEDGERLRDYERSIESAWRVDGRFQIDLEIRRLSPRELYAPDPPPQPGDHFNLSNHVGRFPEHGGVLTTGARSTHAFVGRSILLGPHSIARNTLAHEFGHILGFRDGYVRGYRDLGSDGYEILELVPSTTDIMDSPGYGRVSASHFERILAALLRSVLR